MRRADESVNSLLRDVRSSQPVDGSDGEAVAIFLHGFGSNERDLAGLAGALGLRLPWASLRAPLLMGNGGAAWFEIVTPGDPDPAPLAMATDSVWAWVDANVDPTARVVPIGFSQGGLMASQLLRTRPERVIAPVVLGGFVARGTQPGDDVLAVSRPHVFWGRGAEDRVIAAPAIARTSAFLPTHATLHERVYPGLAHGIDAAEIADVRDFLIEHVGAHAVDAR
jgi:phospholipase/carboxylesterase